MFRKNIFNSFMLWIFMFYVIVGVDMKCPSPLSGNFTQASVIDSLLNNAKNLIDDAMNYSARMTCCCSNDSPYDKPIDCAEIQEKDMHSKSGVHKIWPRSRVTKGPIEVYCDMDDDGGAWTVFQRRGDFDSSKDYFYKDWNEYKVGFGDLQRDHWLGNDNIFALTNQRSNIVKITLSDWEGNDAFASYDEFWIEGESRNYTLHVSGYRGTAGDSLHSHNGLPFTTKDRDNDTRPSFNCAVLRFGAWWFYHCHSSHLNGMYLKGAQKIHYQGVQWHTFRANNYSLKDTVMKTRPKDFRNSQDVTKQ